MKFYTSYDTANQEYRAIRHIRRTKPALAPKVFKLFRIDNGAILLMELISGFSLELPIYAFIYGNSDASNEFRNVGEALRELHSIDPGDLPSKSLPVSNSELLNDIRPIANKLVDLKIIDSTIRNRIIRAAENIGVDGGLFEVVTLHGELYFTHVFFSRGKCMFIDFENSFKGPLYFDLASLIISIYGSLVIPKRFALRIESLVDKFIQTYSMCVSAPFSRESLNLATLYVLLLVVDETCRDMNSYSLKTRFVTRMKLKRLNWLINKQLVSLHF